MMRNAGARDTRPGAAYTMWVQLTSIQNVEQSGAMRTYHPGDFVEVGKQTAMLWISRNEAILPGGIIVSSATTSIPNKSGAVVPIGKRSIMMATLEGFNGIEGKPYPNYAYTVIWDGELPINVGQVAVGFSLLDKWEMAVPLYDYKVLACHVGVDAEREETQKVIRDLRVPLYDTRLMFVKKTDATERLFRAYNKIDFEERKLAFLMALYQVKPFILALPATWAGWNYAG